MTHTPDPKRLIRTISTGSVLFLLLLLASATLAGNSPGTVVSDRGTTGAFDLISSVEYVPGQLVVKFAEDVNGVDVAFEGVTMAVAGYLGHSGAYLINVNSSVDLEQISNQLADEPEVEYAHPNYTFVQLHAVQGSYPFPDEVSSGSYHRQPAVSLLNVDDAQQSATGAGVTVAVIDGGIEFEHPLYEGAAVSAYDYVDSDVDASDEAGGLASGHGTFVGGVLHLMAPDATLRSYRVIDVNGYGDGFTLARAIEQAVDDGCDLINLSLVLSDRHLAVRDAIAYAASQGVAVFAAAGNDGLSEPTYPAAEAHVTAVAAVNDDMTLSDFSNFGSYIDICAPGSDVYSGYLGTPYAWWSGTSFATPFITGAAALLRQVDGDVSPESIDWVLGSTAVDLDGDNPTITGQLGSGLIDPVAALSAVSSTDNAWVVPDTLTIEVIQGAMYFGPPSGVANLSSSNAPAAYTYELIEIDSLFVNVMPIVGQTNDSLVIQVTEFPEVGQYYNLVRFFVEGCPDPVDLIVCQNVVQEIPSDLSASPPSFSFSAAEGTEILYYGASLISSTNAPATISASVTTGGSFITLDTVVASTNDSLRFTVSPAQAGSAGSYEGNIQVTVDGVADILNIPVFLTIYDSTSTGDSAWVTIEPDSVFYLAQDTGSAAYGVLHVQSTNAPASYTIGLYGPASFLTLDEPIGLTNEALNFTVSAEGLTPGVYHDTVKVWVDGVINSPVIKVVTLLVGDTPPDGDSLIVSPPNVWFYMPEGVDSMTLYSITASSPTDSLLYTVNVRDNSDFTVIFDSIGYTTQNHTIGVVNDPSFTPGTYTDTLDFWASGAVDPVTCILFLIVTDTGSGNDTLFTVAPSEVSITVPLGTARTVDTAVYVGYPGDPESYTVLVQGVNDLAQFDVAGGLTGQPFQFSMNASADLPVGVYVDTLAFYLDDYTLPDPGPVYCHLHLQVVDTSTGGGGGGGDDPDAWIVPDWLRFVAAEGATELQTESVVIQSIDSQANFFGYVAGGPTSFASLRDSLGTVGENIYVDVDPTGFPAGIYYDSAIFEIEGHGGFLVLELALAVDSTAPVTALNNFPNPFNPQTTISFNLTTPGQVSLKVYNVLGQEVITLVDDRLEVGQHEYIWNGTSSGGSPVGSGVYFYRLTTERVSATRKLLLLR